MTELIDPVQPSASAPEQKPVQAGGVAVFTISDAIEKYKRLGENSVYPGYRDLIVKMIDNGLQTDFENDSYLDALFLTGMMFNRSQKSIQLFTGNNGDGFLKVLSIQFERALERIKKSNGSVKIILLSSALPIWLEDLKSKYQGTLDIALAKAIAPVKHFILCDSKMARLEEPHEELKPETLATAIKAKVYFNDPQRCKSLESLFEAMWQRLKGASSPPP
jgi:hypothetical protein